MSEPSDEVERQRACDQSLAYLGDALPGFIQRMFANLRVEGFTEDQALRLCEAYLHGSANGRLHQ